ncbi:MAG: class I SAM-dependent methyltransferase [Bacteroidetes bacterium]|nr:class I SAM-dependent methyltransferase [Bacteroidota bacterium]
MLGRGHFPYQLSWLIDNPMRRLLVTPEQLANRLPLMESSVILEVGPGSGYFSVELARRVPRGRLELLDLQPEMLAKAKRKLLAGGFQNVGFTTQDASSPLPYEDETFDIVVMVAVLGEVSSAEKCLRELLRVVRLGGVLVVHEHMPDPDRIPLSELRLLIEECGYMFRERSGPLWNYTATFERPIDG